jgi:dTDP-glucose pyrophosphorylase
MNRSPRPPTALELALDHLRGIHNETPGRHVSAAQVANACNIAVGTAATALRRLVELGQAFQQLEPQHPNQPLAVRGLYIFNEGFKASWH